LIQREARVAELVPSEAWLTKATPTPSLAHLSASERERCAATWGRMALLEHASIAAFARFTLQLLSLGAPPALVEQSTQALADETAHARLCFTMTSAYAGRAVGPGPLDIAGSLEPTSLGEIVDLVLAEGCFGETGAALEALEAAQMAQDPLVREAYERIARDEQRHAELAFCFVRWVLERDAELVASRIQLACLSPELSSHAAREVALPCLRALLSVAGLPFGARASESTRPSTVAASVAREPSI
jgi:hypothetical protein